MADGSITFSVNLDEKDAEKKLEKLNSSIQKTRQQIDDMSSKRDAADKKSSILGGTIEGEQRKLAELKAQLVDLQNTARDKTLSPDMRNAATAQMPALRQDIAEQQQRVNALQREWNTTTASVERYDQRISDANAKLDQQISQAGQLEKQVAAASDASNAMPGALEHASASMEAFTNRIKGLAKRVFIFSMITRALRALRTWLWNNIKANDEAAQAVANLKGALLTMAQPLLNVVIPAFTTLVNVLSKVVMAAARVVSLLFGSNIAKSASQAQKSLEKEADAISGVGSAAEEAEGSLASFDEINTIETEDQSGGGGGAGGLETGKTPDFQSLISASLDAIVELFAGTALLALGAILTFSGANLPLGIGLMVIGAALIADAVTTNWEAVQQALQGPIGAVFAAVSTALLVVGAILAFSGVNIPLGIALMAMGVAGIATVAALNWTAIQDALRGPIGAVVTAVSTELLMIGALLAFSGVNTPLGIALMAMGALSMAAVVAVNWDTISDALQGPIGVITVLVSGALLVIGAVLLFSGCNIPLGLGMLAVGAMGLAATLAANWDTISDALSGPIRSVTTLVSGALLALGAILLFTGAGIPLGLGLILAGAAGLAASAFAPKWGWLGDKLREVLTDVRGVVNKIIDCIEGLVNYVIGGINWVLGGINSLASIFGFELNWQVGEIQIPRLAQGAVVPPNREFMAVLGDNKKETEVVSPLSTIKQAVAEALRESGGFGGGDIHITVELDGKVVARNTVKHINQMTIAAGKPVLMI